MRGHFELDSLEFRNPILCDDVRKEDTGKYILIGVYSFSILLSQIPGQIMLRLFGELIPKSTGELELEFQFCLNDEPKSGVELKLNVTGTDPDLFATPPVPISIDQPGKLVLRCREGRGEWVALIEKDVSVIPRSTTSP